MGGAVSFRNVSKRYDRHHPDQFAVRDLDLEIADAEFMVLVGPSGCGKSTALRMIAGLEEVTDGDLFIGDERVNDKPPSSRDVAMVFQNYALYPHMSVRENMGFALEMSKVNKREIARRVKEAASILDLSELLDRTPKQLSGGQRQRVAMGRAIVRSPRVFLMDEPLSNLDAKLRVAMRSEIIRLQQRLTTTMVYVTHDQIEAMTMGDRVAVMRKGELQQVAEPYELYDRPVNLFVAGFIGSPAMNLLDAAIERRGDEVWVAVGDHRLRLDPHAVSRYPGVLARDGGRAVLGIRPEHMGVASGEPDDQCLEISVELAETMGSETLVHFTIESPPVLTDDVREAYEAADDTEGAGGLLAAEPGTTTLAAKLDGTVRATAGDRLRLSVRTSLAHLFDAESGLPLR